MLIDPKTYATDAERAAYYAGQRNARRSMTEHLERAAKARQASRDEAEKEYLSWMEDAS